MQNKSVFSDAYVCWLVHNCDTHQGMRSVGDTYHLQNRNGNWYYRRRLSGAIAEHFGAGEIKVSLKTRSKNEAKKLRTREDAKVDALIEDLESECSPTKAITGTRKLSATELANYLRSHFERRFRDAIDRMLANPPDSNEAHQDIIIDLEREIQELLDFETPYHHEWVSAESKDIVKSMGDNVELTDEAAGQFGERIRQGLIKYNRRLLSAYAGKTEYGAVATSGNTAKPVPTFGEVADQYLSEAIQDAEINGRSRKWPLRLKADVALVVEMVGASTQLISVDYDACMQVRSKLATLPKNRNKSYANLTIEEAISQGHVDGKAGLSVTTQKLYLGTLKNILRLAVRKGMISTNPAADIKPILKDKISDGEKRHPWSF